MRESDVLTEKEQAYKETIAKLYREIERNQKLLKSIMLQLEEKSVVDKQTEWEAKQFRKLRNSLPGKVAAKVYHIIKK